MGLHAIASVMNNPVPVCTGGLAGRATRKEKAPRRVPGLVSRRVSRPGGRQSRPGGVIWMRFATRREWADDGTDMTREVIMAVPTPSRSLQRDHVRVVIITDRPCYRPPCGPGAIAGR